LYYSPNISRAVRMKKEIWVRHAIHTGKKRNTVLVGTPHGK